MFLFLSRCHNLTQVAFEHTMLCFGLLSCGITGKRHQHLAINAFFLKIL